MIPLGDDNPTTRFPFVTIAIIVVNAAVFIYQATLTGMHDTVFVMKTAAVPFEITRFEDVFPASYVPPPLTVFTAAFVHGDFLHIGANMLFLWIFGNNVEDRLGHLWFIVFYGAMAVAAAGAHVMADPSSMAPMIGASGAIAGVLGAYFVLFPHAHIRTLIVFIYFVRIVKVPAVLFLGLWFAIQVMSSGGGGGVAWYAHIGGFLAGVFTIALTVLREKGRKRRPGGGGNGTGGGYLH